MEKGEPSDERRELAGQLLLILGPNAEKGEEDRRKKLADLIGPRRRTRRDGAKRWPGSGDGAAGNVSSSTARSALLPSAIASTGAAVKSAPIYRPSG